MNRAFQKIVAEAEVEGSRLLVGVSGGVDSVVLLDLLVLLARDFELELQVFHLDHQVRTASGDDARFVRELCADRGLICHSERVDVPKYALDRRLSLETAGREVRRERLLLRAEEQRCSRIVLAHHLDDQAETFLQRLLRGSGQAGLQAMRGNEGVWWRPLLDFSRQEILAYARHRLLEWVEDASNRDPQYLRNRIRHQLVPLLRTYNPRISQLLSGLSLQFQQDEDFWQQQVEKHWPTLLISDADGLRLSVQGLNDTHPALRVRLLREALRRLRGDLTGIAAIHLNAVVDLLHSGRTQAELYLPDCWIARRYEQLWLRTCAPVHEPFGFELNLDEPLILPDGRTLVARIQDAPQGETPFRVEFAADRVQLPLRVRSLRPGDRFVPSGMRGTRKLKDYLIDHKIEKEQRGSLPLLLNQKEILWLVGLRRSALAAVTHQGQKTLTVSVIGAPERETKPL